MCGRYQVHAPIEQIAREFDAVLTGDAAELAPRYNVAPSLKVPAVRVRDNARELTALTWGLVPSWSKDLSGTKPINARAETVFDTPPFRTAIRRRRCLLPANGFYEWQERPGGRQPWHIGMLDGSLLALAGIWEYWRRGDKVLVSCAIVVTDANELVAEIHQRMPVIIARADYAQWLDPSLSDPGEIAKLLLPYPADEMRAYPVSTRVNNAKNEGAELIQSVAEA
jgi:putative SOS response-associated peptidase YedK